MGGIHGCGTTDAGDLRSVWLCGRSGTIIGEGDEILHFTVAAANEADAKARVAPFEALAKEICGEVKVATVSRNVGETVELDVSLQFTCTAEKLIFEMRSRAL